MNKCFCLLIIFCQFGHALYGSEWGPVNGGIQMSISATGQKAKTGTNQSVSLSISFRNISTNRMFRLYVANGIEFDPGYTWRVTSPSGKDISPDMNKIDPSDSGGFIPLLPNKTNNFELNLSSLCNFTECGVYKITGQKRIYSPASNKAIVVVSNPLSVKAGRCQ
jgi:hypothetical protein